VFDPDVKPVCTFIRLPVFDTVPDIHVPRVSVGATEDAPEMSTADMHVNDVLSLRAE
jgi:hypothetical protein